MRYQGELANPGAIALGWSPALQKILPLGEEVKAGLKEGSHENESC